MRRALSTRNIFDKKHTTYEFVGVWQDVFGSPSTNGIWLIQGEEKNGKTGGALIIAKMLSKREKVHYISAEEGTDLEFKQAVQRAGIDINDNIQFTEYEELTDLYKRLKKQRAPRIVVIDNLTIYNDELRGGKIKQLLKDFPGHHFICLVHEEKGKPYGAAAKLASKLAKVIIKAKGLALIVGGRVPGGNLIIDEKRATLIHGDNIKNNEK